MNSEIQSKIDDYLNLMPQVCAEILSYNTQMAWLAIYVSIGFFCLIPVIVICAKVFKEGAIYCTLIPIVVFAPIFLVSGIHTLWKIDVAPNMYIYEHLMHGVR